MIEQESTQALNPDEWYTCAEALERLSENSGRKISGNYLSGIKVDSYLDISTGRKRYCKSQIDDYVVHKRGPRKGYMSAFRTTYEQRRKRTLSAHYQLTPQQYDDMFIGQMGVCAICGEEPQRGTLLFVDHCHKTGQVRGLLCPQCNYLLGNARDRIAILKNAIQYLQKYR